jgi:hypothetical protein
VEGDAGRVAAGVVSVIWYILWAPVMWITGCLISD